MEEINKSELDLERQLFGVKHFPQQNHLARLWHNGWVEELDKPPLRRKLPAALAYCLLGGALATGMAMGKLAGIADWSLLILGAILVFVGLEELVRALKFSPTRLELEQDRYQPGELLRGKLHCRRGLAASKKTEVTLQYIAQVLVWDQPKIGCYRNAPEAVNIEQYRSEWTIDAENFPDGVIPLPMPLEIPLPNENGKSNTVLTGQWKYAWRLTLRADLPGRDFKSEFLLPIFDEE
ncbi:MAG: hypothetical protein HN909_03465 [Phycisphaerales bacterium]|jgi:hypothetical protein|nr:hypothetical protein [Phycisphaerales bacterium]MBT7170811.1 hypothetical protein [Phycisphaerales bacterium]